MDSSKAPSRSVKWSVEAKFTVLLETAGLNEQELGAYCRDKGLYPNEVKAWKTSSLQGLSGEGLVDTKSLKQSQQQVRALEKELRRKEKALAESAALLVLQKKYQALWGDGE